MAFDPLDIATAIAPLWPRLLFWYMAAIVATSFRDLPAAFRSARTLFSQPGVVFDDPLSPEFAGYLLFPLEMALICTVGLASLWGLHRGRDWGRWGGILVFLVQGLTLIADACSMVATMLGRSSNATEKVNAIFVNLSPVGQAMGSFLLLLFLVTGLRRRSLARHHRTTTVRLPRSHVPPMQDWALLAATIIAGLVATYLLSGLAGFRIITTILRPEDTTFVVAWSFYARVVVHLLVGLLGLAAILWICRKPDIACSVLIDLYILSSVPEALDLAHTGFSRSLNKWEIAPTEFTRFAMIWVFALTVFLFARTTRKERGQMVSGTTRSTAFGRPEARSIP